ncbi:MAG: protein-disulfide reductase DsbD domain-containing protein [Roseibacillus sp.]
MKLLGLVALLSLAALTAQARPVRSGKVEAELVSGSRSVRFGETVTVALRMKMDATWHSYWLNPGEAGASIKVVWNLPEGFKAGALQFPVPHRFAGSGLVGFGYENEVFLFTDIVVPQELTAKTVTLKASVSWLVCDPSQCFPGRTSLSLTLPLMNEAPKANSWNKKLIEAHKLIPREVPGAKVNIARDKEDWVITLQLPKEWQGFPSNPQFFPENRNFADLGAEAQFKDTEGGFEIRVAVSPEVEELKNPVRFVFAGMKRPLWFSATAPVVKNQ